MFWYSDERMNDRVVGVYEPDENSYEESNNEKAYVYVLDGQQRITVLSYCAKGKKVFTPAKGKKKPGEINFREILIDLSVDESDVTDDEDGKSIVTLEKKVKERKKNEPGNFITVKDLYDWDVEDDAKRDHPKCGRIIKYQKRFVSTLFPLVI